MKANILSFLILLVFAALFAVAAYMTHKKIQEKSVYVSTLKDTVVALDPFTFHNKTLFNRASLIAAESINLGKTLISTEQPIYSIATVQNKFVYFINDVHLFRLDLDTGKIARYKLPAQTKISALSYDEALSHHLIGLTNEASFVFLHVEEEKKEVLVKKIEGADFGASNLKAEALWNNPVNHQLTMIAHNMKDTQLTMISAKDWKNTVSQLIIPNIVFKSGIDLSLSHKMLLSEDGHLYVLNMTNQQLMHIYEGQIHTSQDKETLDMAYLDNALLFTLFNPQSLKYEIQKLSWSKRNDIIVMNDMVQNINNKISFEWKLFSEKITHPNYYVDVLLKSNDLTGASILGLGPLENASVALPLNVPLEKISGAKAHDSIKDAQLSYFLDTHQSLTLKIVAIDSRGRGVASVKNFPIKISDAKKEAVPDAIRELFLQP